MNYPENMLITQMQWAFEHLERCLFDPDAPPQTLRYWECTFVHFANELRKYKNNED